MERRTQIKTVICGVALVALASIRPASAQTNPCIGEGSGSGGGICNRFDADHQTNKYQFGDHFIKFTVNVVDPFDLNVEFIPITDPELDARVIPPLAPVDCIRYVGATSDTSLGTCGYYHVTSPPSPDHYTGNVTVRIFWDFPTLALLHNVRLYRAPLDGVPPDGTCTLGFDCYTQDITDQVFAIGDHNSDAGVSGSGDGFSDFEAVDQTGPTSTAARVWLGLKNSDDVGTRFDLKAIVTQNGTPVSSGTLLGVLGGSSGFNNANLRTIPLSLPSSAFTSGDAMSIEVSTRVSCVGNSHTSGTARLWFNDAAANSRVNEPGAPTLSLVMPGATLDLATSPGTGPKKTKDVLVRGRDFSCNGPFTSFGTWTGLVP